MAEASQPDDGRLAQRRQFIKRAAVVSGAVWVAPTIISLSPASAAAAHSAPPGPPVVSATSVGDPTVLGTELARDPAPKPATTRLADALAKTGSDLKLDAALGVAGLTGGAALRTWSSDVQRKAEAAAAEAEELELAQAAHSAAPNEAEAAGVSEADVLAVFEGLDGTASNVWSADIDTRVALVAAAESDVPAAPTPEGD